MQKHGELTGRDLTISGAECGWLSKG
jgi:hypothetical protein